MKIQNALLFIHRRIEWHVFGAIGQNHLFMDKIAVSATKLNNSSVNQNQVLDLAIWTNHSTVRLHLNLIVKWPVCMTSQLSGPSQSTPCASFGLTEVICNKIGVQSKLVGLPCCLCIVDTITQRCFLSGNGSSCVGLRSSIITTSSTSSGATSILIFSSHLSSGLPLLQRGSLSSQQCSLCSYNVGFLLATLTIC